jgi:hypothetical protein
MRLVDELGEIAGLKKEAMGAVIKNALEVYVTAHATLIAEQQRLNDERARLTGQADTPGWRRQVEGFNRQIAAYNERWAWYPKPR